MTNQELSHEVLITGEKEIEHVSLFSQLTIIAMVLFLLVGTGLPLLFFDTMTPSDAPNEITRTIIATDNLSANDSSHAVDLTGNGLLDYVVGNESGELYWYEQTAIGTFISHTINTSHVSGAKVEGVIFIDMDNDHNYELIVMDQENDEIRIYIPDTLGHYSGTWSSVTILSSRKQVQRPIAFDVDGDETNELVYAFEGNGTSTGGLHWLDYDSGPLNASSSFTDYVMVAEPGAWWIGSERRDISGNGKATDIVFSSRSGSFNTTPGIFVALEPGTVTDTWKTVKIEIENKDWLHVYFGNFFGTSEQDIIAHAFDGTIALYDHDKNWARTSIGADVTEAGYNVFPHYLYRNDRQKFITTGRATGILGKVRMVEWYWSGSVWTKRVKTGGINQKMDIFLRWDNMNGGGQLELVGSDSYADNFAYYTFPYDGEAYILNERPFIETDISSSPKSSNK